MILLSHITIALSGVTFTAYAFFKPSKNKLNASYALLGLTLLSGTALVLTKPANMTQVCVEGLAFVGLSLAGIVAIHSKLAHNHNE
jgi:hypothetical protein